ncbi:hypothetical protein HDU88_006373 [Geranomyces variabilis]|nr:hypothetical protein HDU88_006373 [Geranomyces variabilis]
MTILDNYHLVNKVVDALWDELVVLLDFKLYGTLVRVNRTFKSVMYLPRRRSEILRGLTASTLSTSTSHPLNTKRLLNNPMLPALEFIARYVTDDKHNPFPVLQKFLAKHASYLASLLPEARKLDGELPSFMAVHTGRVYASQMMRFISPTGKKVFLMGNLRTPYESYWKFAILVLVNDEEEDEDGRWAMRAGYMDRHREVPFQVETFGWEGPLSAHFV